MSEPQSEADGSNDPSMKLRLLLMYWRGRHSTEPELLEVKIVDQADADIGGDAPEATPSAASGGRHVDRSAIEVGLPVPSRDIEETEEPAPDGTPVEFANDWKIVTCAFFPGWWRT